MQGRGTFLLRQVYPVAPNDLAFIVIILPQPPKVLEFQLEATISWLKSTFLNTKIKSEGPGAGEMDLW